ncbi:phosphoribosyl-AMP cyclohydrolase [Methylobacterium sp. J-076]|uniref:phosphoribosyl-AMP cyclohydrolase n=1 Tax=Methylobacterium sp. J-076 TaxID=2836655 RepID=UPI001FB9D7C9|nr:phosphoribosyl-AMP cyclohydrolase [Methylobacterium sp. J-076]MCJ2014148.1 phosphoribosyl-AMP cyclohydrolase [Methylobacterium sp. J-076]
MSETDPSPLRSSGSGIAFPEPGSAAEVEEGTVFTPRFDRDGLITCIAVDAGDGRVLMLAHMNAQSLARTLETGEAWYWSRSRRQLWRKGATSGQTQRVVEMRTDCDQDALLITVEVGGDGGCCHTGRRACFYRTVALDAATGQVRLRPAGE